MAGVGADRTGVDRRRRDRRRGREAISDHGDVATAAGAQALVDATVERFGRLDVLINNAGIVRWAGFPEADEDDFGEHLAVHVTGSFNTTRAAWPHMVEQGYGRIVMTTSTGMFGLPDNLSYATAKAAVIGLTRSLTTAGAAHGIKVNLIAPAAFTRMAGAPDGATPVPARRRCPRISSLRWSPSSPTRPARSAARSTSPAPVASRASSSPRRWATSTPASEPTIEDVAAELGRHQRRDGVRRADRSRGLVGHVHGPPAPRRSPAPGSVSRVTDHRARTRSTTDATVRVVADACRSRPLDGPLR